MWHGPRRYELLWRHSIGSFDRDAAVAFLQSTQTDAGGIWELRNLLQERGMDLERFSDERVIEEVANLIGSGAVVVGFREEISGSVVNQEAEQPIRRPAVAPAAPRPAPPDPDTFPSNHDPAIQARALVGAARRGAPFCAECEKALQQTRPSVSPRPIAQPPPRDPATLPSNCDAAAQARALISASRRGTAFCEQCERAKHGG